ncbi:hypothetical protein P3S67_007656 [Capsicum chacoense]
MVGSWMTLLWLHEYLSILSSRYSLDDECNPEKNDSWPQRNGGPRVEWLGETEREMARIVREWVETAEIVRIAQPEHIRRDMFRLRGRQVLLDLLMRIERERQRELQGLLEHRAVSDFAHHNQIQSLRGRFLHERPAEEERPPSIAASELVQLRQCNTVSGLSLESCG